MCSGESSGQNLRMEDVFKLPCVVGDLHGHLDIQDLLVGWVSCILRDVRVKIMGKIGHNGSFSLLF